MTAPPMSVVECSELSVSHQGAPALEDVSFSIGSGDYVGIVGPNGSGKTTLIRALLGLAPCDKGRVSLFGTPLRSFSQWHRIGYLPQIAESANRWFPATVGEVVAMGRLSMRRFPRTLKAEDRQAVDGVLEMLRIGGLKSRLIGEISGGQRQRVLLARALVSSPELVILDEPTEALDPETREGFYQTLQEMNRQKGTTVLLITHDSASIGNYATKLLYLDRRVVFYGGMGDFCRSDMMTGYFGQHSQHLICHQH